MGLFMSKEEKEAIKAEKDAKLMAKYGLENIQDPKDIASVRKIISELVGTGAMETGMSLSAIGKSAEDILPVYYQRAILEQNWIIIRQLDRIASRLEILDR